METKTQNPTATLRALRTCKTCKGLCHEGSYRTKNDEHKTYFCCEAHARGYYAGRWYHIFERDGIQFPWRNPKFQYTDEQWEHDKEFWLESVDITTPRERMVYEAHNGKNEWKFEYQNKQ
jgi:hypothetical protein